MRILFLSLMAVLILGIATADVRLPVQRPEHNLNDSSKDLLSTLQELHQSLITQIALLENMQRSADMMHLILHYTAQKDNIEREIALITSIEADPSKGTGPRHIFKSLQPEERLFQNLFKKNKDTSTTDQSNNDDANAFPYSPYDISSQHPQLLYSYQEPPHYQYPNDLISDTFPGYQPHHSHYQQMFGNRDQPPNAYQMSPQPTSQVPQQYSTPPKVTLHAQVPPSQTKPQKAPNMKLPQSQQKPQRVPNMKQPKPQTKPTPTKPPRTKYKTQTLDATLNKTQPEREMITEAGTQPTEYFEKPEVLIYYPDGVDEDDDIRQRPTIVNRFGQVFDRFGQVISNLANRQRPMFGSNANVPQTLRTMNSNGYPMSSSDDEVKVEARKLENKRKRLRWVSV